MTESTLLYRWFGLGKVPSDELRRLEAEEIVYRAEGIPGSIRLRYFRAHGRRSVYRRSWTSGSIVVTRKRLIIFTMYPLLRTLVDAPLDSTRIRQMECGVEDDTTLVIRFGAGLFHEDRSGEVECRFRAPDVRLLQDRIAPKMRAISPPESIDVEALWRDPKNWSAMGYNCRSDPRILVPKRLRWTGWTFNFAHPISFVFLIVFLLLALLPTLVVLSIGGGNKEVLGAVAFSIVTVWGLALILHLRSRGAMK